MKRSILMLEHDDDDRYITQAVFNEVGFPVSLHFISTTNELFAHLLTCERMLAPMPSLILLSQQATPLDAVDVITSLKSNPQYRHIPIVVLSGSTSHDILRRCYDAGANSFIQKPSSVHEVNQKISSFVRYWFETVALPR